MNRTDPWRPMYGHPAAGSGRQPKRYDAAVKRGGRRWCPDGHPEDTPADGPAGSVGRGRTGARQGSNVTQGGSAVEQDGSAGGRLVRTAAWAGLRSGDAVAVEGTRLRGARWEFVAHVRNRATGAEWIEVVGGRGGDRTLRSFDPGQVFPAIGRPVRSAGRHRSSAGRAPSLADAPQLPLGPSAGTPPPTGGGRAAGRRSAS